MSLDTLQHWLSADRIIALAGFALTVVGVYVALWQIRKVRKASESAQKASESTRATIRSGSLGRLIRLSMEHRGRLEALPDSASEAIKTVARNWVDVSVEIEPLLGSSVDLPAELKQSVLIQLQDVRALAKTVVEERVNWLAYFGKTLETSPLTEGLLLYEASMGSVLLRLEDREVERNA